MGGYGDDLKKDFKSIFKHGKKAVNGFFRDKSRKYCDKDNDSYSSLGRRPPYGCNRPPFWGGYPPFIKSKSPWVILFYPKICVGILLLLTLLFCGVSLYGLVIIILLGVILIII